MLLLLLLLGGILFAQTQDLLDRVDSLDERSADSYYVPGQIYPAVRNEFEVSVGIEDEPNYGFYLKLVEHPADRGWHANSRNRTPSENRILREAQELLDKL